MTKRLAFILNDIHEVPENELQPNEVLVDYTTGDFVYIDNDMQPISITKTLKEELENKLPIEHMEDSNQHLLASIKNHGFMSMTDKSMLEKIAKFYNTVKDINFINDKLMNRNIIDGVVDDIILSSKGDVLNINAYDMIINKELLHINPTTFKITRPNKNFININKEIGLRDDLIVLMIKSIDNKLEYFYKYITNVSFENEYGVDIYRKDFIPYEGSKIIDELLFKRKERNIYVAGNGDKYSQFKLDSSTGYVYMIPLIRLKVLNDEKFNTDNINGNITEELDIEMETMKLYNKIFLGNINFDKILMDNVNALENNMLLTKEPLKGFIDMYGVEPLRKNDNTILYVNFNKNDVEEISNIKLQKQCTFTQSIFGHMLSSAQNEGMMIDISNKLYDMELDFTILNNFSIKNSDNILKLIDINNNELYKIELKNILNEKYIILKDSLNDVIILSYKLPETEYLFIKMTYSSNKLSLFINSNKVTYSKMVSLKLNSVYYAKISVLNIPIGNIRMNSRISNDFIADKLLMSDMCSYNNKILLNKSINGYKVIENIIDLDFYNGDGGKILIDNAIYGKLNKNDKITILKNKDEMIYGELKNIGNIIDIQHDIITLDKNMDLVKNNMIKIIDKDYNNIENIYSIVEIVDVDKIRVNTSLSNAMIGMYICDVTHTPRPELIDKDGNVIDIMVLDNVNTTTIFIKDNITSPLTLKYYSIIKESTRIIQDGIKYIVLNKNTLYKLPEKLFIDKQFISINYNNSSKPFVNNLTITESKDFTFNITINTGNINRLMTSLNKAVVRLAYYSNGELNIGEYKCNVNANNIVEKDFMINYNIVDNKINIPVSIKGVNDINVIILKDIDIFINTENIYGNMEIDNSDFVKITDEIEIFSSTDNNILKIVHTKTPNQEIELLDSYEPLTREYIHNKNSYKLVEIENEIKLLKNNNQLFNIIDRPIVK